LSNYEISMDAAKSQDATRHGQFGTEAPQSFAFPQAADTALNNDCDNCRLLEAKVRRLQERLELESRRFSEAIGQLTSSSRAKLRVEQLDERFIEQCVRAKTQAEVELAEKSKFHLAQVEKIKADAQNKNNELAREANKLRHQLNEQAGEHQRRLAEVAENARHDAARYEQIITALKAQASQKIKQTVSQVQQQYATLLDKARHLEQQNLRLRQEFQKRLSQAASELEQKSQAYQQTTAHLKQQYEQSITAINNQAECRLREKEQQIASMRTQLEQAGEQATAIAREKARAGQLNQRLIEQCRMAKAGADVEIEMRTKELTEGVAQLKGQAASRLAVLADENSKLKAQVQQAVARLKEHADALNRANVRIKSLEHIVTDLKRPSFIAS